jgi:hypothetical protein
MPPTLAGLCWLRWFKNGLQIETDSTCIRLQRGGVPVALCQWCDAQAAEEDDVASSLSLHSSSKPRPS